MSSRLCTSPSSSLTAIMDSPSVSQLESGSVIITKNDAAEQDSTDSYARPKRGLYFWLTFFAVCLSLFMSALEAVSSIQYRAIVFLCILVHH